MQLFIYLTEWFQQQTEITLMNKCLSKFDVSVRRKELLQEKHTVVVCASGFRSPSEIAAVQQKYPEFMIDHRRIAVAGKKFHLRDISTIT